MTATIDTARQERPLDAVQVQTGYIGNKTVREHG